jgi:hypothetical protein
MVISPVKGARPSAARALPSPPPNRSDGGVAAAVKVVAFLTNSKNEEPAQPPHFSSLEACAAAANGFGPKTLSIAREVYAEYTRFQVSTSCVLAVNFDLLCTSNSHSRA